VACALTEELRDTPGSAPFAVNQIVHRTNARLEHDLELCVKYKAPVVITSLGAREDVNQAVHGYGGLVLHDVISEMRDEYHAALERVVATVASASSGPAALMSGSRGAVAH
jgi:nitronate monooxygenase